MAQKRRSLLYLPLVIAFCSLLGGIYGPRVEVAAAATEDDIRSSLRVFTKVYNTVEQNFADPLNPDKAVYKGAIPGILRNLDPHSNFFDPRDFQSLQEDQKGHYYGTGMTVGQRRREGKGVIVIILPQIGAPAYRAGIHPGDVIVTVDGKSTDNLTTAEAARMLKGPRGTPVRIVVKRECDAEPITFNVVRDEIPRKSVHASWVKPGIAYLDIESFSSETTNAEVEENLKRLGESNITGLILDLRQNPGGLVTQGVAVADRFLHKGQEIVSHYGRLSPKKSYVARHGNGNRDYPIVVLVNRYSASAAEIVSGALQDHDRAWILGENTFGKGLVQSIFHLQENTGLTLTTAKYYTPSGRLIQRDYSHISFFNYYNHKDLDSKNLQDVKMTDGGRTVYGGGGISPDEKYVPPKYNPFQTQLLTKFAFFNFATRYFCTHDTKLPVNWMPDRNTLTAFQDYLTKEKFRFSPEEFDQNKDWIKRNIRQELYASAFGADEARRIAVEADPMVEKAVESMPKAMALVQSAHRVIVQRLSK
jgi:carboxyl-terminal processing protease